MNSIRSRFVKFSSTALALLITVLTAMLLPSGALAKDHKVKGPSTRPM
jgi:hypothetical protein